jgi:hypothetical protein
MSDVAARQTCLDLWNHRGTAAIGLGSGGAEGLDPARHRVGI